MTAPSTHDTPAAGSQAYSLAQIVLHWTIAAMVIFQLVFNKPMQEAFDDRMDGAVPDDMVGALVHAGVGIAVLVLAVLRLTLRLTRGAPGAHDDKPAIFNWLGLVTHWLLYGFIFLMPVTGALAWFAGIEFSAELHELGRLVLIPAIGFHVLGALAEHFVFRNNSLSRMLKPDGRIL